MDTVGKWDKKIRDSPEGILHWLGERLLVPPAPRPPPTHPAVWSSRWA